MKQVASLRYGVMFKKAFCDPEIFTAFAQDILGIQFEIDQVETEKSFSPVIGRVDARFDLYAEDRKHRTVVDIQHERYPDHYHRFLHYQCVAILEQVVNAEDYRPPLKVFTIVVLTSGDRHKCDVAIIDFDPKDAQGRGLREIPHKVFYLCPKYVSDDTPEPYREWLRAIADSLDEEVDETQYTRPAIRKIFDYIEKDQISRCMARMSMNKSKMAFSRGRRFDDLRGARSGSVSTILVVIVFLGSCRVSPLY